MKYADSEAVVFLTGWISYLLIIIPVAAGTMVTYHSVRKAYSNDDNVIAECNTRIKHTIIGAVIGMTISGLITVFRTFYGA